MGWTLGGVRIFVQEYNGTQVQTIARLQPLLNKTIYHVFGYETIIFKVKCIVIGYTDIQALRDMTTTGTTYTLIDPDGNTAEYLVKSVDSSRRFGIAQTIRPDLDCDAPVFDVSLEIYLDE